MCIDIDLLLELGPSKKTLWCSFLLICTSGVAYGTILDAFAKAFHNSKTTGQVPGSRAENVHRTTQNDATNLDRQASLMMPYKWRRKWRTWDIQKMQMEMRRGRQWQEIMKHLENRKHTASWNLHVAHGICRRMESVSKCVITTASLRWGEDMKSFHFFCCWKVQIRVVKQSLVLEWFIRHYMMSLDDLLNNNRIISCYNIICIL